jgi:arabinogalactan oligomer / maltooligosaccharide transport system substrate-binding protein
MILRKRSLATALVLAVAASGVIVAPSFAAVNPAKVVTIWSGAASAKDDEQTPIIAAWAKTQGITINVVYKKDVRNEFIKAVPEGKGPDLMVGAHDWTGQLVGAGTVAPIVIGSLGNQFSKDMKSGFTIGGKLYGMPIYSENIALIWNKRDGKDPAGMTMAQLIASKPGLAMPIQKSATNGDPYHMSAIASSFGITLFTRNSAGWTKTVGYGATGADAYAAWLVENGQKLIPTDGWDKSACHIQNGGYAISGPWMYNHAQDTISGCAGKPLTKAEVGITNIPSAGGKTVHQMSGVYGYWQSVKVAGAKNSVNVGKVLRYIGGASFQVEFQKKANNIPANADARAQLSDKNLTAFGAAGVNAYPMPAWVFLDSVWAKIGQAEQALVWGTSTGTPGDFLRKAVTSLQSTVDAA